MSEFRLLMRDIGIILRAAGIEDCTCPCLDCIEGTHCGGVYIDDESGEMIGECHEVVDEGPPIGYWPPDEEEE